MYDIEENPILWLRQFSIGLAALVFLNIVTGCWTVFLIHSSFPRQAKLPICLLGLTVLALLSTKCFDPRTHIIGSIIGAVSMTFTTPLQSTAWLQRKLANPAEPTSNYEIIFRIAIPAALPNPKHPSEPAYVQLLRGAFYLFLGGKARHLFDECLHKGGVRVDLLGMFFIITCATGALNCTSAVLALLGVQSPSPFRRPLLAPTMGHFWAGQWNSPVSDSLRIAIYDPLRKVHGWSRGAASMACFFVSAVAHEAVLLYCGVRDSKGEWFCFFVLSGMLTISERKVHGVLRPGLPRRLFAIVVFCAMFHFLFLPVTIRTGFAHEGVRAMGTGPVLVDYISRTYFV